MKPIISGAAAALMLSAAAAANEPPRITFSGPSPQITDPATGNSFRIRGRFYFDAAYINSDTPGLDRSFRETNARAARLGVQGTYNRFSYVAELDFAENNVDAKDISLSYRMDNGMTVTFGHFKTPNSMEHLTSSTNITFMERGQPNGAFRLDRRIGVMLSTGGDAHSFAVGVFGGGFGENLSGSALSESMAIAARGTLTPVNSNGNVLHLGAHVRYFDAGDGPGVRVRSRPTFRYAPRYIDANTGQDSSVLYGLEAAWISGPMHIHAEAMREDVDGVSADFTSGFVSAGWFLTGETRAYRANNGTFQRTAPANAVSAGGNGAWELAGRYEITDLDASGRLQTWTAGLNWYPERFVRFMFNYVHTEVRGAGSVYGPGTVNGFQARAQIDW